MMARRGVLGVLAGGAAALLSGCGRGERLKYKMTVEVDTPEGVKSGYAVREVRFSAKSGTFFAEGSATWRVRGEAVAVDLGGGKLLFALLVSQGRRESYAGNDIWDLLEDKPKARDGKLELWPSMPAMGGLPPDLKAEIILPMLVTFTDTNDPKSVQRVDPANLAASFGPGVSLKRIVVEVTDEAVTSGIEKRLGWLEGHQGSLDFTGQLHPDNPEKDITNKAFRQGQ
jgi:hypothetical protein